MKWVGALFLAVLINLILVAPVNAEDLNDVVISQIKSGNSATARLIEIYNNSDSAKDVTNWCIYYNPASATTLGLDSGSKRGCLISSNEDFKYRLLLPARSHALLGSSQLGITTDILMSEGLGSGSTGHVFISDSNGSIGDVFGWGVDAKSPESLPFVMSPSNSLRIMERKSASPGVYQESGNNAEDFFDSTLRPEYSVGNLVEVVDYCLNLEGIQPEVPPEFIASDDGLCEEIENPDPDPPSHLPLTITELLPNAEGSDEGSEFIEIYNPHDQPVGLAGYKLHIGPNFEKTITLPDNLEISPKQFLSFYNSGFNFTLLNSSSRASLTNPAGVIVSESESYQDPGDGVAWARFDDGWKMTQTATPNAANIYLWVEASEAEDSSGSCPAGKFRNPETNRCKNIESASGLKPCSADQVRNPETNRCRKITSATSSLTPCKLGQERNPETNRCRKINSSSGNVKPCQSGYERNPETNRCRKASSSAVGALASPAAINPVKLDSRIIAVLIALAAGYAAYEYRSDVSRLLQRLRDKRGNPRPPG